MIAALCFVVGVVILDELGRVLRQRIDHTSGQGICTVFVVHRALGAHGFSLLKAGITGILTVKISVGVHTGHIVHGHKMNQAEKRVFLIKRLLDEDRRYRGMEVPADSYEQKLNILAGLHHRITDEMITTMAIACDIEVNDGETEERYEELKNCLLTMEKFECNRLR